MKKTMRLGFTVSQFKEDAGPDELLDVTRQAEDLDYDSLWAIECLLYLPVEAREYREH